MRSMRYASRLGLIVGLLGFLPYFVSSVRIDRVMAVRSLSHGIYSADSSAIIDGLIIFLLN